MVFSLQNITSQLHKRKEIFLLHHELKINIHFAKRAVTVFFFLGMTCCNERAYQDFSPESLWVLNVVNVVTCKKKTFSQTCQRQVILHFVKYNHGVTVLQRTVPVFLLSTWFCTHICVWMMSCLFFKLGRMDSEGKKPKKHQQKHSGPKADRKKLKKQGPQQEEDERKRNPKAFAVQSAVRMAKTFHRSVLLIYSTM